MHVTDFLSRFIYLFDVFWDLCVMANALQNSATFFFINETDLNSKQAGFYFVDGIVTTETKRNRTKILWAQCCLLDLNRSLKHQSCFGSAVFTYIKLRISLLVVKYFPHLSIIQHHLPSSGWEREREKKYSCAIDSFKLGSTRAKSEHY